VVGRCFMATVNDERDECGWLSLLCIHYYRHDGRWHAKGEIRPRHAADRPTGRWSSLSVHAVSVAMGPVSSLIVDAHALCSVSVRPPRPSSTSPADLPLCCACRRPSLRSPPSPSSPPDLHLRHHNGSRLDGPARHHRCRIKASFPQRLDSRDFVQHICFGYSVRGWPQSASHSLPPENFLTVIRTDICNFRSLRIATALESREVTGLPISSDIVFRHSVFGLGRRVPKSYSVTYFLFLESVL